jgi:hypothetical protein
MLRPLGFILSILMAASALAQPPAVNADLSRRWAPELGECPQVYWLPGKAPPAKAVLAADNLEDLLVKYPYQAMVQGSWLTLSVDGKVETIELQDGSGDHQLFRSEDYLVSLLRKNCRDLSSQESLCQVSAVVRRLNPPEAEVLPMVEYYGCFDDAPTPDHKPAQDSKPAPAAQPIDKP